MAEKRNNRNSRNSYDGGDKNGSRMLKRRGKACPLCVSNIKIDYTYYKDTSKSRYGISERGKILRRGATGMCRRHQRQVRIAIQRARLIALLPYSSNEVK